MVGSPTLDGSKVFPASALLAATARQFIRFETPSEAGFVKDARGNVMDPRSCANRLRRWARPNWLLLLSVLLFGNAFAQSPFGVELDTDRAGSDYSRVTANSVDECRLLCETDANCAAYTFAKPQTGGQRSSCWLKRPAPLPSDNLCCVSGARGGTPNLTLVTANWAGSWDVQGVNWTTRVDRFTSNISFLTPLPDVISITEFEGWRSCIIPPESVGDYDVVDRLVDQIARQTGVIYRVAYMAGVTGSLGWFDRCHYFSGDVLLYNATRLVNRTADDAIGRVTNAHDGQMAGFQLRRSLPMCNRGTHLRPLESLLDGPVQTDKCGRPTPAGFAWAWKLPNGRLTATAARFSFLHDRRSSFDVVTIHTVDLEPPESQRSPVEAFVDGVSKFPFRTMPKTIPTIIVGDANKMLRGPNDVKLPGWPDGFVEVFAAPDDFGEPMTVMFGTVGGTPPPVYRLATGTGRLLPLDTTSCGGASTALFSDHCALWVNLIWPDAPPSSPVPPLGTLSITISPQPLHFGVETSFTISAIDDLTGQAPTEKMTVTIHNYNARGLPQDTVPVPSDGKSPLEVRVTFHAGVSIDPRTHVRSLDKAPTVKINVPGYKSFLATPDFLF